MVPKMEAFSMEVANSLPMTAQTRVVTYKLINKNIMINAPARFIKYLLKIFGTGNRDAISLSGFKYITITCGLQMNFGMVKLI